jgi:acyl carrier protein
MNSLILERTKRILADVMSFSIDDITLETDSRNIEAWDSLNHLNLILALEQEFHVRFAPEEIQQMLNVEEIANKVMEKTAK